MRHGSFRAAPKTLTLALIGGALALASFGCAKPQTACTVTSLKDRACYAPSFKRAYASRDHGGDLNVVCAADVAPGPKAREAMPNATALRQIMHIKVLWEPGHGMKVDQPTSTNAAIRWYVFDETAGGGALIEYAGTGLAEVETDDGVTTVEVRNATLNPVHTRGLHDPIGPARFQGTVVARTDKQRVADLLAEVKTTLAAVASTEGASAVAGNAVP